MSTKVDSEALIPIAIVQMKMSAIQAGDPKNIAMARMS
jgi:hypothetical protein